MAAFNAEIWDPLLESQASKPQQRPSVVKRQNIVYRIFHLGEQTPTEDGEMWGKSRYDSGSDLDSEDEASSARSRSRSRDSTRDSKDMRDPRDRESTTKQNAKKDSPRHASKSSISNRKGIFSVGDDSSDYDSDQEVVPKRKTSIFKELLMGSKKNSKTASPASTPSISTHSVDEEPHSHGIFKELLAPLRRNTSKEQVSSAASPASAHLKPNFASLGRRPSKSPTPDKEPSNTSTSSLARTSSELSLNEKYGKLEDVLGRGSFATVRLCCPQKSNKKYAVKEFRKKRRDETQKEYVKKLIAEFCISSTLDHENIVKTVDLIQDSKKSWCVVMEYCAGGDLYSKIVQGQLLTAEAYCYFVQLLRGVQYLHQNGVSHRDLKPENLLLDASGRILKITDFGVSEVFRTPFAQTCKKMRGVAGSGPYIAPEEFSKDEYDTEKVDVWSVGVILYFT